MDFGLEKCAVIHIKKGKFKSLPDVQDIPLLGEDDSYKYLGILQADILLHDKAKRSAKKEFFTRVRKILKAELTAKHTVNAITTYAMPVMRYGFGVLSWTVNELNAIDNK